MGLGQGSYVAVEALLEGGHYPPTQASYCGFPRICGLPRTTAVFRALLRFSANYRRFSAALPPVTLQRFSAQGLRWQEPVP